MFIDRYEGQRDMLYNQTFNLDQVAFASKGIKDAQQTVCSMQHLNLSLSRSFERGEGEINESVTSSML